MKAIDHSYIVNRFGFTDKIGDGRDYRITVIHERSLEKNYLIFKEGNGNEETMTVFKKTLAGLEREPEPFKVGRIISNEDDDDENNNSLI